MSFICIIVTVNPEDMSLSILLHLLPSDFIFDFLTQGARIWVFFFVSFSMMVTIWKILVTYICFKGSICKNFSLKHYKITKNFLT